MKKQTKVLKLTRETLHDLQLAEAQGGGPGPFHQYPGGQTTIPTAHASCSSWGVNCNPSIL